MCDCKIKKVKARWVLDSRGNPTVEVDVITDCGLSRAMVPSGASTGVHEALELRDNTKRFLGKGVNKAVGNVNRVISKKIIGLDPCEQQKIDKTMIKFDGTENKSNLGANAILGVSMAVCRAAAHAQCSSLYQHIGNLMGNKKFILPVPSMNVINGGKHAGNKLDMQEYMIMPIGAKNFKEGIEICTEVYQTLKNIIKDRYGKNAINVGDEGGFAPPLTGPEEPFDLILKAIDETGHEGKIKLAMDPASSEFYKNGVYILEGVGYTSEEVIDKYRDFVSRYPIVSIEDGLSQDDWSGWIKLTKELGKKIQIVGDDLLVTNTRRIRTAIAKKACNALLLKINQIGTISESIEAAKLSLKNRWNVMVSHRSGETEDPFIADLVVGLGTGQIKSGAPARSERNAKYNQLLRIEEELGKKAIYAGKNFRR